MDGQFLTNTGFYGTTEALLGASTENWMQTVNQLVLGSTINMLQDEIMSNEVYGFADFNDPTACPSDLARKIHKRQ